MCTSKAGPRRFPEVKAVRERKTSRATRPIRMVKLPSTQAVMAKGRADVEEKTSLAELIFRWLLKTQVKMLSHSLEIEVWILQGKYGLEMPVQESLGHRWYLKS